MIDVWTDGSCLGNPGAGGAAAISSNFAVCHGDSATTNNAMEITAVIIALEKCLAAGRLEVTIHTDSTYVKQGIQSWITSWKRKSWRTAANKPVKNKDLWQALDEAREHHEVTWRWVKGHAGHPGNERADELAREGLEAHRK